MTKPDEQEDDFGFEPECEHEDADLAYATRILTALTATGRE